MAAPAVIRVKRSRDEAPLEALIVSSKRRKCDEGKEEGPFTAVITFAGTINKENGNVHSELSKVLEKKDCRADLGTSYVPPKITEKVRKNLRVRWKEDRFKVVSLFRSQGEHSESLEGAQSEMLAEQLTIVDIERSSYEGDEGASSSSKNEDYEYDLYYVESAVDLCPGGVMDTLLSVQPYELVGPGEAVDSEEEAGWEPSDNEDDENNWRNDYPEEESSEDEGGDDAKEGRRCRRDVDSDEELLQQMASCGIGDGVELSDDADDEDLVYGRDEDPFDAYCRRNTRELRSTDSSSEAGSLELSDYED